MRTRQLLRTLCFALALLASGNVLATTETYDFTKLGNKVNPTKGEQVTIGGKTMWKLTYGTETFDGKFAYGARLDNGNDDSNNYRFINETSDKGFDITYSNRSFAVLNVKNGDIITFNVFKNTFSIVGTSYLRGLADNGTIESGSSYTVVSNSNEAVDILLKSDADHAEMQSVTIQDGSGEYYDFEAVGKQSLDNNSINPISVNNNTFNGRFSTEQANCFAANGSGWGFQINYNKWFSINNLKAGDEFMVKYKTEGSQVLEFDDPTAVGKTDSDKGVASETWYTLTKDVEQLKLKNTINTNGYKTDYLNITIITNCDNNGSGDSGDSEEEVLTPPSISVSGQTITINPGSSSKEGATATTKYTLDGKDPKTDGTELNSSIEITGSATIKAYTYSSEKETDIVTEKKAIIKTAPNYNSDGYGTFYFDQAANGSYYVPTPGTLQLGEETFSNRFEIASTRTDENVFKFAHPSNDYKGLYSQYNDRTFSILNLKKGDKVTITISKKTDNETINLKFNKTDGLAVVSGQEYIVENDGSFDFISTGSVYIESVKIEAGEEITAPVISYAGGNKVSITPGASTNTGATITTVFTTDGTEPSYTDANTHNGTIIEGEGATTEVLASSVTKIIATTFSSTADVTGKTEFDFSYVADPVISCENNIVTISDVDGIEFYYTMGSNADDTAEPTKSEERKYTAPISLTANAYIKVKAFSTTTNNSSTTVGNSYTYNITIVNLPIVTATSTISGSAVTNTITITAAEGTTIYYTTNGAEPTTGSTPYTAALTRDESATIKAIAVKDGATSSVATLEFKAIATAPTIVRKGNHVIITAGATDEETNSATTKYQIGEGEETAIGDPIALTADNTTIKAITSTTSGNKIEVSQTFEKVETIVAPQISISETGVATITGGESNISGATVNTYYTTDGTVPTVSSTKYTATVSLTDNQTIKAISVSEYDSSVYNVSSEVAEDTYTAPLHTNGYGIYDFTAISGNPINQDANHYAEGTELYLLAIDGDVYDNRFAIGPNSRKGDNGFYFRIASADYKGLYSQYDKRNFSILNLKQGDKVTINISKADQTLKFSDTSKVLEITSATDNTAAKLAEGATAKSGTAYYITGDCNLDFVTTGGVYIESVKIEEAAEGDTAPTIAETVSKPTITDNGDNTISITAGVSDADKKVTTYYTTDGSVPTAESTKYEEALALTADCTVKAITISEQGTKSEVAELAFTIKVPTHQDGYGLFDFTLYGKDDKGADAIVKPDYGTDGELAIGKEDFDNRFISGPSNRIEDNTCFRFRNSGNYKGLWSQYSDRTLALKDLAISDTIIITMNASAAALKFTGTPIVANVESGDNVESGKVYIVTTAGQLDLITSGEAYIEDIVINKGNGTLPELVSTPKMQPRQGKYNTVIIVPGKSSDSKAQVTTYYTTDGSEPTAANGTAINRETDVTFAATTTAVKAVSISSTGAVGDVATYAVSYVEPIANGEPYSFVGYGSTGGVVPEWGRTVTASGETQQLIAIGIEDFGERFAAGPTSQNTGANCFKFREAGGYQGLFSQYADRYFSVLNLRVGDQVIVNISKKDDEEVNLYSTVTGRAVESGEPITVTSPGSLLFRSTGSVYIESVLILNTGSGTYLEPYDEEEDEDNTGDDNTGDNTGGDTPQEPEQPNTPVENEDGSVTTAYSFTSFGDASGVVPEWGEDVQVGDVTLQMLSIGDEDFGNKIACGPKRGDDKVFKFRNSGGYQGLYSQYADRYLSILDLKNGDQVTIVMNANANNLAFNGDPQVEVEQPSRARAKAIAATTEPSNGDKVGSGVTYTVKTSQASTSLDFVTTGSVYITQIIIREAAGTTRILDIEKLRDSGIERIYDMSGRRVQQMVKGRLYIVNGKKVLYK